LLPLFAARPSPGVLLALRHTLAATMSASLSRLCLCKHEERHISSSLRLAVVGARYIVPGKLTWRDVTHLPRTCGGVIPSEVSRAFAFARSAGTQDGAPRSTASRAWGISRGISLRCTISTGTHDERCTRRGCLSTLPVRESTSVRASSAIPPHTAHFRKGTPSRESTQIASVACPIHRAYPEPFRPG
jgi:hypothetical protein